MCCELKTWEEPADKTYGEECRCSVYWATFACVTRQGVPSRPLLRAPETNHPGSFVPAASVRAGTGPLLPAEFGENLAVLPRGLIDRQLVYSLEFKLPQS